MKTTIPKLRRIIRKVITESNYWWMKGKKGSGFPFTDTQWAATDQAEKDAYMDWAFGDDEDELEGERGVDGQEEYDQERVDRMIMLLDDLLQENPELEYDEDAVFHALQGMVPDANEEEIAEAMASF